MPRLLLLSILVAFLGCAGTKTVKFDGLSGIKYEFKPTKNPFALIEARAYKTFDSTPQLLAAAASSASELGAKAISCPSISGPGGAEEALVSVAQLEAAAKIVSASTDVIKGVLEFPLTLRAVGVSEKTLVCAAYD